MPDIAEANEYDEKAVRAEELLAEGSYMAAVRAADDVLKELEPSLPALSQAALVRSKALLLEQMRIMELTGEMPTERGVLRLAKRSLKLSERIEPDNPEAHGLLHQLARIERSLPPPPPHKDVRKAHVDVLIVGAGAAGVGVAQTLVESFGMDRTRVVLVERGKEAGESFRRWPAEMRFISPSFNQRGWTNSFDLNSVGPDTSPAYSLHEEHPTGQQYAKYLAAIVESFKLNIKTKTEVTSIVDVSPRKGVPLFEVDLMPTEGLDHGETLVARYVIWAAGEFQYPVRSPGLEKKGGGTKKGEEEKKSEEKEEKGTSEKGAQVGAAAEEEKEEEEGLVGAELCLHNSQVRSWAKLPGDEFLVIGGYESGVDAAFNLAKAGKAVKVLASRPTWNVQTADPSAELAPYTAARLREVMDPGFNGPRPKLMAPLRVLKVEEVDSADGKYRVTAEWKKATEEPKGPMRDLSSLDVLPQEGNEEGTVLVLHTHNPPVLCTGFEGSVRAAARDLFAFADDEDENDDEDMKKRKKGCMAGAPLLTEHDESTKVPGVFLVGPTVSHGKHSFCFVYKFRQRFAVVADAICRGLGYDNELAVKKCRDNNMYMDDLSCCNDTCGDVC